ncbi:MAG TPA: hypothetical protein VGM98_17470 [Schlesneria sp.]|jgi:hypothetical protein
MPTFNRMLWRLAGKLANRLALQPQPAVNVDLTLTRFAPLQSLAGRIEQSIRRGWPIALQHCVRELQTQLVRTCRHLDDVAKSLRTPLRSELPTQRFLYEELKTLSDEFEDVEFDLREETISVISIPITFDDIELGRFRVVLNGKDLVTGLFQVIARTPNPAVSRPDITHPHVYDNRLCEGDATVPLQNALWDGRFCDFFPIVQQTLLTYNSSSPYVSLSDWNGTRCRICDDSVSDDDSCCCDHCEQDVCDSCSTYCDHCCQTACDDCRETCSHCEERSCASCLAVCPDCRLKYCSSCLINQLCEDCDAARNEESNTEAEESDTSGEPAVYTDRVGEAAIPA